MGLTMDLHFCSLNVSRSAEQTSDPTTRHPIERVHQLWAQKCDVGHIQDGLRILINPVSKKLIQRLICALIYLQIEH